MKMHQIKNRIRSRTSILWFIVLVYLMAALGDTDGLILCYGLDGHIAVETALIGSKCGPSSSATSQTTSCTQSMMDDNSTQAHCTSCVDIPLLPDFLNQCFFRVKNRVLLSKVPLIATFSFVPSTFARMSLSGFSLQPLIDNNFPLAFIRTVILLI